MLYGRGRLSLNMWCVGRPWLLTLFASLADVQTAGFFVFRLMFVVWLCFVLQSDNFLTAVL